MAMQQVEGLRLAGLLISPALRHFADVKLMDTHVTKLPFPTATLQHKVMEGGVHTTACSYVI
jgi:hypothetical protein